jgi:hypothetical protein
MIWSPIAASAANVGTATQQALTAFWEYFTVPSKSPANRMDVANLNTFTVPRAKSASGSMLTKMKDNVQYGFESTKNAYGSLTSTVRLNGRNLQVSEYRGGALLIPPSSRRDNFTPVNDLVAVTRDDLDPSYLVEIDTAKKPDETWPGIKVQGNTVLVAYNSNTAGYLRAAIAASGNNENTAKYLQAAYLWLTGELACLRVTANNTPTLSYTQLAVPAHLNSSSVVDGYIALSKDFLESNPLFDGKQIVTNNEFFIGASGYALDSGRGAQIAWKHNDEVHVVFSRINVEGYRDTKGNPIKIPSAAEIPAMSKFPASTTTLESVPPRMLKDVLDENVVDPINDYVVKPLVAGLYSAGWWLLIGLSLLVVLYVVTH